MATKKISKSKIAANRKKMERIIFLDTQKWIKSKEGKAAYRRAKKRRYR